ncbi:MAG: 4Fe-4S dicluster domain-containing protein [Planctomycetota bacterium]|nr:4Fe-4S dicluster domain-containing protein [Planctomycetota bacterium]
MNDTQYMTESEVTAVVPEVAGFKGCFGCAKCTSGCPTADQMDVKPHQVMRLLQLGRLEDLLASVSPWLCVGCQTCLARCPNKVDIPAVLVSIRAEAVRKGLIANAGNILFFDELLLGMIERRGRVNDGLMALRYKLHAGGLLKDWRVGMKMFNAGKMKLRVPGVVDVEAVARLFNEHHAPSEDEK